MRCYFYVKMPTFQDFRDNISTNEKSIYKGHAICISPDSEKMGLSKEEYIYAVSNERNLTSIVSEIEGMQTDTYIGVVGGVLSNVVLLGALNHQGSIYLTDLNLRSIDHLAFMLYSMPNDGDLEKFVYNLENLKFSEQRLEQLFGRDSKGNVPNMGLYNVKNRRYVFEKVSRFIKENNEYYIKKGMIKMNNALKQNQILPFVSDINGLGINLVNTILEDANKAFIYLSDVRTTSNTINKMIKGRNLDKLSVVANLSYYNRLYHVK